MEYLPEKYQKPGRSFHVVHLSHPSKLIVAVIFILSIASFFFIKNDSFHSQTKTENPPTFEAKVMEILSERVPSESDTTFVSTTKIQELSAEVDFGTATKRISVTNIYNPLKVGSTIFVRGASSDPGEEFYEIVAIGRNWSLLLLAIFFMLFVFATSGMKGINAFVGLVLSFSIIFNFIVPQILNGANPVAVSLIGSMLILVGTLYVSYGFNKKSVSALISIAITLLFVGLLAYFLVYNLSFTGNASEETTFLLSTVKNKINLVGLLIAGIIIAAIGVLDDVAITQASVVAELLATDPSLSHTSVFKKAMNLGKGHISAVVNTLVLAYTGASLPLVLLFIVGGASVKSLISSESIAEEIVRTLVATTGLVAAVPITTFIAVLLFKRDTEERDGQAIMRNDVR